MASLEDWVISESVQDAIANFSSTVWEVQALNEDVKDLTEIYDGLDDALAEIDIEGSWLRLGEVHFLINDSCEAAAELERRQKVTQQKIDGLEKKRKELERLSEGMKHTIEAALGERVRLNMD